MNNKNTYKRLTELLLTEKRDVYSIYTFAIFSSLIQLSIPLGVQSIIGFVLAGSFSSSIVVLISLMVIGVFLSGMFQLQQMKVIEKLQQKIFHYYAFNFKENTLTIDLKKSDNLYIPELMNRFLDVSSLQKSLSKLLLDIPIASIQIIFGLLIVAIFHPLFLVMVVLLLTFIVAIFIFTSKKGLETSIKESSYKYEVAGWLEEIARVVNAFKMNRKFGLPKSVMEEKLNGYLKYRSKHFGILILQFKNLIFLKIVITAVMLIVGTYLLLNQELNIGQFVAAEIIIITMISSVEKLIINLDSYYDVLTSIDKLNIIQNEPKEVELEQTLDLIVNDYGMKVEFNDVSFKYLDEKSIFENINFILTPGQKVAVSGIGGSGKSTLLRLFSTLYNPDTGVVLFNDIPVHSLNLLNVRPYIGIMYNKPDLFNGTFYHNITMGNPNIKFQKIVNWAKKIGLDEFVNTNDLGYNTVIDTIGKRLPRSVIKKVLFLRAVIASNPLIILEEPFSDLSEEVVKYMEDIILNELKYSTVIIVTRRTDFIEKCDRHFILNDKQFFVAK